LTVFIYLQEFEASHDAYDNTQARIH